MNFKKYIFLVLSYLTFSNNFSQESNLNIDANLPILLGQNFLADNYFGIFDLGLSYQFAEFKTTKIGSSINTSFLRDSNNGRLDAFDIRVYVIQPKIFSKFNIVSNQNFHFKTGLGYSLFIFDLVQNENTAQFNADQDTVENENGIALNLGLVYDFGRRFYADVQYDFIKIVGNENRLANTYSTNLNILKIGLGIKF